MAAYYSSTSLKSYPARHIFATTEAHTFTSNTNSPRRPQSCVAASHGISRCRAVAMYDTCPQHAAPTHAPRLSLCSRSPTPPPSHRLKNMLRGYAGESLPTCHPASTPTRTCHSTRDWPPQPAGQAPATPLRHAYLGSGQPVAAQVPTRLDHMVWRSGLGQTLTGAPET